MGFKAGTGENVWNVVYRIAESPDREIFSLRFGTKCYMQ
jgi:hypothetical protein